MKKEKIRILHFVPNLFSGGTETYIMNMYRHIDRDKFQFDFAVHTNQIGVFENEIEALGGRVFRFPIKDDINFFKYIKSLNKFFKEHKEIQIVHAGMPSIAFLYLFIAKKNGIKVRIAHSHTSFYTKNIKGILKHFTSMLMKYESNYNLACSNLAGKYMFKNKKYKILYNAINLDKFKYNKRVRNEMRKKYNIEDKIVLGNVGRISKEKNHIFMINILEKLLKINNKYYMVFVGTGELENQMKDIVKKRNLEDHVLFAGVTDKVEDYLQMFDIFILPSLYEGLSIASIEAQEAKLPCLVTDFIPKEAIQTNYIKKLKLKENLWVKEIEKLRNFKRNNLINSKLEKNYDINKEVKKLEEFYTKAVR